MEAGAGLEGLAEVHPEVGVALAIGDEEDRGEVAQEVVALVAVEVQPILTSRGLLGVDVGHSVTIGRYGERVYL